MNSLMMSSLIRDTDKTAVAEDSSTCHDRNYIYEMMCCVMNCGFIIGMSCLIRDYSAIDREMSSAHVIVLRRDQT